MREELIRFGKTVCMVSRPEQVIGRIATAMSETLTAYRTYLANEYGARLVAEWEDSRRVLLS